MIRKHFINLFFYSLVLTLIGSIQNSFAQGTVIKVVAVVNGEAILSRDIDKRINEFTTALQQANNAIPNYDNLYQDALDSLVVEKLQQQRVKQLNIEVTNEEITNAINNILQSNNSTLIEFLEFRGISVAEFRQEIREEIGVQKAVYIDNRRDLQIGDEDINQILRLNFAQNNIKEYLVAHAIVPKNQETRVIELENASPSEFNNLAEQYSVSENDVILGWRTENNLPSRYMEEINNLNPGEISPAIDLPNGMHIIYLLAARPIVPGQSRIGQVKLKILTVDLEIDDDDLIDLVQVIKSGEFTFEEAALDYEGEIETIETYPENLLLVIKNNLDLRIGEIKGPFTLPESKAIVQVLEIEQVILGDEQLRERAFQIAANNNIEDLRRKWVENLRAFGTVEIVRATPN